MSRTKDGTGTKVVPLSERLTRLHFWINTLSPDDISRLYRLAELHSGAERILSNWEYSVSHPLVPKGHGGDEEKSSDGKPDLRTVMQY